MFEGHNFRRGDLVIYRKYKHRASPGPRAKEVEPEPKGEEYSYCVDKFWIVTDVNQREVILATRRGKQHVVDIEDPNLRPARWWERILFRDRFPTNTELASARSA